MSDIYKIDGQKITLHPERIRQWQESPAHTFPLYIEVSPVGHCNHRCTFCAVDYIGYKTRSLDIVRWSPIVRDMATHGVKSVMFAGEGEPLLHPNIGDMITITKDAGIDVALTTNAVPLNKRVLEVMNKITWIKVSCNAGRSQTYAAVHRTKERDWDLVWDNLRLAVAEKRARTLPTTIGIQMVLLPDNMHEVSELVFKAKNIGLDYVVIKPYSQHKMSETHTYENIKYKELESILENIECYNTADFEVIVRRKSMQAWDSLDRGYQKCLSTPYFWAYIMATGDVYGCSAYLLDERFKYGNIGEQLFSEIWLGERRTKSMAYVLSELDISECRKNCRMHKVNEHLWDIMHPGPHHNFI